MIKLSVKIKNIITRRHLRKYLEYTYGITMHYRWETWIATMKVNNEVHYICVSHTLNGIEKIIHDRITKYMDSSQLAQYGTADAITEKKSAVTKAFLKELTNNGLNEEQIYTIKQKCKALSKAYSAVVKFKWHAMFVANIYTTDDVHIHEELMNVFLETEYPDFEKFMLSEWKETRIK